MDQPTNEDVKKNSLAVEGKEMSSAGRGITIKWPTWVRLLYSLLGPFIVAFVLYIPFGLLASKINPAFDSSGNFFYRWAILTWPTYVAFTSGLIFIGIEVFGVGLLGRLVTFLVGIKAILETDRLDPWLAHIAGWWGWSGYPRDGLDMHPITENINTVQLSVYSLPIVYLISAIVASWIGRAFTRRE